VCADSLKNLCAVCADSSKNVCAVLCCAAVCVYVCADSLKIELKSGKWECFFFKPAIPFLCRKCKTAGDFIYEVQRRLFL
jgi:hypothetical protein